eukprot:1158447-Pelagomonas_calceolata.AAC.7
MSIERQQAVAAASGGTPQLQAPPSELQHCVGNLGLVKRGMCVCVCGCQAHHRMARVCRIVWSALVREVPEFKDALFGADCT